MLPLSRVNPREVLDRTGRSFALSLRWLPKPLREPVELAYLLARAADTIADREWIPDAARRPALAALRTALRRGEAEWRLDLPLGAGAPPDARARAEAALLGWTPVLFERWRRLPGDDRADVAEVVVRLVGAMEAELDRFGAGELLAALPDAASLKAYTEDMAGCVGVFWTRSLARHCVQLSPPRQRALEIEGRRYGRGLQLVNILRDAPRDLRRGRCYLPAVELFAAGLTPDDLLDPAAAPRLEPVLRRWEARARRGLLAGLVYTTRLPLRPWRLRAATALPARIGLLTLDRLARPSARLDPTVIARITRNQTRRAVIACACWSLFPRGPLRLARAR